MTHAPYAGEHLGPRPHVAVIFRDQIGDFVVATPLMRGMRERFPDIVLDYFGGERTRELEEASRLVAARFSLFGGSTDSLSTFIERRTREAGPYSLAVNLESDPTAARVSGMLFPRFVVGAFVDPITGEDRTPPTNGIDRLWSDVWNRADLLADYPELRTQFIGEIFCRLARVETDFTRAEVPLATAPFQTPSVLIATGASRGAKLWPEEHWTALTSWLINRGHQVGLLGAAAPVQIATYHAGAVDDILVAQGVADLRGSLTLPQVAGALASARVFVTVDNGLMHLAAAVGAPTFALFGASPQRIWAPRSPSVQILEPSNPCSLCEENRFRNADCLLPIHQCMQSVELARLIRDLSPLLEG
ncbi:MAG: heptosyltransferase family protein [Chloroflexi bacterium]|nr:heptosyltransferase family protein [Chloroflexota bacterium]